MAQPVVHFEIIGRDPQALRDYYGRLFGWGFDTGGPVAPEVSDPGAYGFTGDAGLAGGVGGGQAREPHVVFYIGVPDVEAALERAERLGGTRRFGPVTSPGTSLVVGQFTDPEGNLVGIAGTG